MEIAGKDHPAAPVSVRPPPTSTPQPPGTRDVTPGTLLSQLCSQCGVPLGSGGGGWSGWSRELVGPMGVCGVRASCLDPG